MAIDRNKFDPYEAWEKGLEKVAAANRASQQAEKLKEEEAAAKAARKAARLARIADRQANPNKMNNSMKAAITNLARNPNYFSELARKGHEKRRLKKLLEAQANA